MGFALSLFINVFASAGDWSHWLGPNGDKTVAADAAFDPNLDHWEIAWQADVGLGYSSITTANGKAYTIGHDGQSNEILYCLDPETGKTLWTRRYEAELLPKLHKGGPNASVTISGNRLYALSKDGLAYCLDAQNGRELWKTRLTDIFGIEMPRWGFASSPLEYKGQILLSGGKTTALDKTNGKPNWVSENAYRPGYGTPVVFNAKGKEYIAAFDSDGLSILSASDGKEIARHPVKAKYNLTAATPTITDEGRNIFITLNSMSELLSFDGQTLSVKWSNRKLQNYTSGNVLIDGTVYGIDGNYKTIKSSLYAMDLESGNEYWSKPEYGYASLIAVGSTLLILTENGDLVTARANKKGYHEISRKPLLDNICWTDPVYTNGRIYVRNDQGTLICLKPTSR